MAGPDFDPDPGPDHERILREIRESRPRLECLGCAVSGGWAVAAVITAVVAAVYVLARLT